MKTLIAFCCLVGAALLSNLSAAEIRGKVSGASGEIATVVVDGDLVPAVGDAARIFFLLPGADEEISVADGKVAEVNADVVKVKIENATGSVSADQLARFTSDKPQKKTAAAAAPASSTATTAAMTPPPSTAELPGIVPPDNRPINFDALRAGNFPLNTFVSRGVRFVAEKGEPLIAKAEPNMVLPADHKNVLLLGGEHVTSLIITFDEPIRRFGVTRIGTRGGASVPTWTLDALNAEGKVVSSAGEEHGLPKTPKTFSVRGNAIVRVRLQTDNRFGNGTWATWSSLPVAEFEIER